MQPGGGARQLVQTLESLGVETIFGIPGIHNLDIYDQLLHSTVRHVTSRNESGAAFMADGYARSTNRPGVALVISGPGLTNALTGLGEARHDSVPVVCISSDIPRRYRNGPEGYLHQLSSPTTMTASVTKEQLRVEAPEEIDAALRYLYHLATSGRPGPVHLEIPIDVLQESVVAGEGVPSSAASPASPAITIDSIVDTLVNAAVIATTDDDAPRDALAKEEERFSTCIVAGGGAVGAATEIRTLAETLAAPVVTTAAGKGVVPESHPLSLGGRLHLPAVRAAVESADVLLLLGTQLSSTDTWVDRLAPTGTVIAVNIDAAHLNATVTPDIAVRGDVKRVVAELTTALAARGLAHRRIDGNDVHHGRAQPRMQHVRATHTAVAGLKNRAAAEVAATLGQPEALVERMRAVLRQVADALGTEGVLAADMTTAAYAAISEFSTDRPGGFLHPAGFGTLGYALPAAIGVAMRREAPPVAVLAGDGGVQFTIQELAVAVQEELPIPIVIWNDNGYGEIRREEEIRHPGKRIAVDNLAPDFPRLAEAYGAAAVRVGSPEQLGEEIRAALRRTGPTVLDVPAVEHHVVAGTTAAGAEEKR